MFESSKIYFLLFCVAELGMLLLVFFYGIYIYIKKGIKKLCVDLFTFGSGQMKFNLFPSSKRAAVFRFESIPQGKLV